MAEYFVKVDDSRDVRRELLESSKLCIYVLKQEAKIAEIKRRKEQAIAALRDDLKELTFLIGSLEKDLPILTKKELSELAPARPKPLVVKEKVEEIKAPQKTKGKAVAVSENKPVNKELTKLQRLEESLKMIENRLGKL